MIIHSYLTDGFYGWAEIFLKSFFYHHGDEHKIFLSTRDLKNKQVNILRSLYPNIQIINKQLDINNISKRAKLPKEKILELKNNIENGAVNKNNFIWKQAISVEDRYRNSILEAMRYNPDQDYLVHFDIDMYFRKNLEELFNIVKNNDISIKFRLNSKINRKVMGGLIGFKLSQQTDRFMINWIKYIDRVPLYEKPIGYGQTSFYYSYLDFKNKLDWGNIPGKFISPRFLDTDVVWSGNTVAGKTKNLKRCYQDFKEMKS